MPEHFISLKLFDSLDEYILQLDGDEAITDDVVPETSPVIVFVENAFAQFFENEVGSEIKGFDDKSKRRATRLRSSKKDLSKQARALIVLYKQFCDIYDDVRSASYVGQALVLEEFHKKLIVRLLERIRALAGVKHDSELRGRADSVLEEFEATVDLYDWEQHDKKENDDDDE
jgi:hypothetical protein